MLKTLSSRRAWLLQQGSLALGITATAGCLPPLPSFGGVEHADTLLWLRLQPNGRWLFFCPRAEMGQGIATGLRQVIAEELFIEPQDIDCRLPRTDQITPAPMTVGSQSMEQFFLPTAQLAAGLRDYLRARLAQQEQLPVTAISIANGHLQLPDGRRIAFRELVAPQETTLLAQDLLQQSDPTGLEALRSLDPVHVKRTIGRKATPWSARALVTGSATFSRDVLLKDTLFGALAHPPFAGAQLLGYNSNAKLPEGARIVTGSQPDLLGVVAATPHAASAARELLQPTWSDPPAAPSQPFDVDASIEHDEFDHQLIAHGDLTRGAAAASETLTLRYDTAMTAHAAMEPRAASARWTHNLLEVWTASQDPWFVQRSIARLLNLRKTQVVIHNHRLGGSFGGRVLCQAALEAAWLAFHVRRAVKVQWSRREEMQQNYVGPGTSHRIDCGVTDAGELSHWHHRVLGAPILTTSALVPTGWQWLADLPADPGTARGLDLPYRIPHQRVDLADRRMPQPTGPWRGLGAAHNLFAIESAIDELAVAAQIDPLTLRLQHVTDPGLREVLELLGERCRWQLKRPPGQSIGLACGTYKGVTHVAVAAEFKTAENQQPRLHKLWCVHDCGLLISPDQVRAQIEGNLVWGISMARYERFDPDAPPDNFDRYPIARHTDMPAVNIYLHESNRNPVGAGEAALAPTAAAIANAYTRLGLVRPRQLPFEFAT